MPRATQPRRYTPLPLMLLLSIFATRTRRCCADAAFCTYFMLRRYADDFFFAVTIYATPLMLMLICRA